MPLDDQEEETHLTLIPLSLLHYLQFVFRLVSELAEKSQTAFDSPLCGSAHLLCTLHLKKYCELLFDDLWLSHLYPQWINCWKRDSNVGLLLSEIIKWEQTTRVAVIKVSIRTLSKVIRDSTGLQELGKALQGKWVSQTNGHFQQGTQHRPNSKSYSFPVWHLRGRASMVWEIRTFGCST